MKSYIERFYGSLAVFVLLLNLWSFSYSLAADDAGDKKGMGVSFLPFALYTPETGIAGGIGGIYPFRFKGDDPLDRPSSLSLSAKYTQKKQYAIDLTPELYLRAGEYHIKSNILYQKFPLEFYGIGNDTSDDMKENYTPKEGKFKLSFQKRIRGPLNIGIQYEFEDVNIIEVKKNGLMDSGDIPGSDGGRVSGLGLLVDWDSRDGIFCAKKGAYYQLLIMTYKDVLGGDYDFTQSTLDLRRYLPILPSHTLALQGLFKFSTGEPPFQKLALLGGRFMMRGYYEGRYRDKNMLAVQVEYRIIPVWWRVGIVGFLSYGGVSDEASNLELRDFKISGGLGFRFQFDRKEGVNLRADLAYGQGTSGYYLTIFEAF